MNIEPCPFCGSSDENIGRTSESVIRFWVHCRTCYYDGPAKATVEQAIDAHNRLSRIVQAAKAWAKAKRRMQSTEGDEHIQAEVEYLVASGELSKAVEGGDSRNG